MQPAIVRICGVAFAALLLGMAACPAFADVIVKRDGTVIHGKVSVATDALRVVDGRGQIIDVPLDQLTQLALTESVSTQPPAKTPASRPGQTTPVQLVTEGGVWLNQSPDDALNGLPAITQTGTDILAFSDARSRAVPADDVAFSGQLTWDLGATPAADQRQLDSLSIWIAAGDPKRSDYAGELAISVDGKEYFPVNGSAAAVTFPGLAQAPFNHVVYNFAPGAVVEFRYLRFVADTPEDKESTRFVEIDAFVSRAAPDPMRVTGIVTRDGSRIVGEIRAADAQGVRFIGPDAQEHAVPIEQLSRLMWYRVSGEVFAKLPQGSGGALLRSGDFCEGDLRSIEAGKLRVSSVTLGLKAFNISHEMAAFVFNHNDGSETCGRPRNARSNPVNQWTVQLLDGSRLLCSKVSVTPSEMVMIQPALGELHVPWGRVSWIRRTEPQPTAAIK